MKTTHEISITQVDGRPFTFECTRGEDLLNEIKTALKNGGYNITSSDDHGFAAVSSGPGVVHDVTVSMIDI